LQASRPDLRELIAAGGRQSAHVAGQSIRRGLVIAEVALAMMLLIGAALLIRSFGKLAAVSAGFSSDHTIVANISLPSSRYDGDDPRTAFFGELLSRTRALSPVTAAGYTQSVPMVNDFVSGLEIEGRPVADADRPSTNFYAISPGYFEAMRIPLLRGRGITKDDRRDSRRVAAVNEAFVNRFFPHEDPIGKRIRVSQGPGNDWREIVGVVGDVKQYGLGERTSSQVYESYLQHAYFSSLWLVVRTTADDPGAIVPEVRNIVRAMDRELPVSRVRHLDDIVSATIRPQRFSAVLIALFSGAALLLASIGVYGVVSYTVRLRTQEFAIRIAHGATRSDILGLVLRGAVSMAIAGVAIGILGAWLLRQLIEKLLFGVAADDVATYAVVALTLASLAVGASVVPALRATRVNPLVALRE
jgi:predicted permease